MGKIENPNDLNQGTEIIFDFDNLTIQLLIAGNLSNDGVTFQAFYSYMLDERKVDDVFITKRFPFDVISDDRYSIINGWSLKDDTTRKLLRDGGWNELSSTNIIERIYMGVITLGDVEHTTTPFYIQQIDGGTIEDVTFAGAVNEAVQIYGDASNGDFDYTDYFKIFAREPGMTYDESSNIDINKLELQGRSYTFPLSNSIDLNITSTDTEIENNLPFTGINVTYHDTPVLRNINGVDYEFDKIIEGNSATLEQIYNKMQYLLRQNVDIDSGTSSVIGATAELLMTYEGDVLKCTSGVYIDNFLTAEAKNLKVYDVDGILRSFPIVSVLTISGLLEGSYVGIYDNEIDDLGNNNTLLDSIDSSGTSFSYTHDGSDNDVVISIIKYEYEELRLDQHINQDNTTVNVVQVFDNNY